MMWPNSTSGFRIFWIFWSLRIFWISLVSRCYRFPCAYFLLMIQTLPVLVCCYRSPCAYEQLSIPLPSLRTRRCVGIGILICACTRFPWESNLSTWSFEYPRASRRNRTVHIWRTCRNRTGQVHRRRPGFRHNLVFFFLFLHPFRHPFGAANQAENSWHSREWNGWCWTNEEDLSICHVWSFLLSICLRPGVWCQCTWSES